MWYLYDQFINVRLRLCPYPFCPLVLKCNDKRCFILPKGSPPLPFTPNLNVFVTRLSSVLCSNLVVWGYSFSPYVSRSARHCAVRVIFVIARINANASVNSALCSSEVRPEQLERCIYHSCSNTLWLSKRHEWRTFWKVWWKQGMRWKREAAQIARNM
jgi:hypothetical protein